MRQPVRPRGRSMARPAPATARPFSVPSPVRGLVTNTSLSNFRKQSALVLENWFPTQTGIRVRGGTLAFATIDDPCKAMMTYQSGAVQKLFAASADSIYDVTNPSDPDTAPSAAVSSLLSGNWQSVQFEASGGDYLICVNGTDTPREFDGSSWSSSTMSGSGLTVSKLSAVTAHKKRLYFVEDGTMKMWYLGAGAYTGTLTSFSFAGVFKKGGAILYLATWSLDSGAGPDDFLVIVTTEGEVAVYSGTDPASDFALVGLYNVGEPLGKNSFQKIAGDLLMMTKEGIIPISQVVQKDPAALTVSAVSRNIEPTWKEEIIQRAGEDWTIRKWDEQNMLVVGMPSPGASVEKRSLVANLETGAWCVYTGETYDVHAQAVLAGKLYVANSAGDIFLAEATGNDDGAVYTATYVGQFEHLRAQGLEKVVRMMRAVFRASREFVFKSSVSVEYNISLPNPPNSVDESTEDVWDSGLWDEAVWDSDGTATVRSVWRSVERTGFAVAPQIQVTSGVTPRPDAELVAVDLQYEMSASAVV